MADSYRLLASCVALHIYFCRFFRHCASVPRFPVALVGLNCIFVFSEV